MAGTRVIDVDVSTITAAKAGDRVAQSAIVSLMQDPWYRMCLSLLRDPELARDAAQETALRVLRLIPDFRGESSFSTWSMGIAINVVREMRRKRRPDLPGDLPDVAGDTSSGPEEQVTQSELKGVVASALEKLSDRQREVIVCRYFEEMSTEDTAKAMNCAPGTVKATLHQALRALKGKLKQLA